MEIINGINRNFIAFALELVAISYVAYFAWEGVDSLVWRLLIGASLSLVFVVVWGRFFSPKAQQKLTPVGLFWGKLFLLSVPAFAFMAQADFIKAMAYVSLVLAHLLLSAYQATL